MVVVPTILGHIQSQQGVLFAKYSLVPCLLLMQGIKSIRNYKEKWRWLRLKLISVFDEKLLLLSEKLNHQYYQYQQMLVCFIFLFLCFWNSLEHHGFAQKRDVRGLPQIRNLSNFVVLWSNKQFDFCGGKCCDHKTITKLLQIIRHDVWAKICGRGKIRGIFVVSD